MERKYIQGTAENKQEIERIIQGFGGRFSDKGQIRLVNRIKLESEDVHAQFKQYPRTAQARTL